MWLDSWSGLLRIAVIGAAAYLWLIVILRVSGKRTLAKLNAFDFVVTIAVGSTLATILLDTAVSWSEGATALTVLVVAQFLVAFFSSRFRRLRDGLTAAPTLLVRDGEVLHPALKRQRVSESEVMQCVRGTGAADLAGIAAVVLETDGTLSVISRPNLGDGWALQDVERRTNNHRTSDAESW